MKNQKYLQDIFDDFQDHIGIIHENAPQRRLSKKKSLTTWDYPGQTRLG